jgi:N-acetylglutamate synthase-like GNAT family acetyltransferase
LDKILIHPATRKDNAAIRALIRRVRINPTGLAWERFVVAINDTGELTGCGQIKSHADGSCELASITVKEDSRGRGVARAIIEELLRKESFRPLYLMCAGELEPFYQRFGFQRINQG